MQAVTSSTTTLLPHWSMLSRQQQWSLAARRLLSMQATNSVNCITDLTIALSSRHLPTDSSPSTHALSRTHSVLQQRSTTLLWRSRASSSLVLRILSAFPGAAAQPSTCHNYTSPPPTRERVRANSSRGRNSVCLVY
jgi:hypothetical protein